MNTILNIGRQEEVSKVNEVISFTKSEGVQLPSITCVEGMMPDYLMPQLEWYTKLNPSDKMIFLRIFNLRNSSAIDQACLSYSDISFMDCLYNMANKFPNLILTNPNTRLLEEIRKELVGIKVAQSLDTLKTYNLDTEYLTACLGKDNSNVMIREMQAGKKLIMNWIYREYNPKDKFETDTFLRRVFDREVDKDVYFCSRNPHKIRSYIKSEKYKK